MSKKVAVYGSLRQGHGNHRVLGSSKLLGTTNVEGWEMFSLGGFPGIRKGNKSIVVEVYEVDDEGVKRGLDRLEGFRSQDNPDNFYNKAIIETEYGEAEIYTLEGGQYEGSPIVDDGDWTGHRHQPRW